LKFRDQTRFNNIGDKSSSVCDVMLATVHQGFLLIGLYLNETRLWKDRLAGQWR